MGSVLPLLAQQTPPDLSAWLIGTPVTVLAFLTVAWMRGWIVSGITHQRALKENDDLKAEGRALQAVYMEKVIPTLVRATDLIARTAERERSP